MLNILIKNVLFFVCLFSGVELVGQSRQRIIAGPEGAVIVLSGIHENQADIGFLPLGTKIEIWKSENASGTGKKLAEVGFPASAKEMQQRLGPESGQELIRQLKVKSAEDAYRLLLKAGPDTLGVLIFSSRIMEAMGMVYTDRNWKPGQAAYYRFHLNGSSGRKENIHQEEAKSKTYAHRFSLHGYARTDSSVTAIWAAPASSEMPLFARIFKQSGHRSTAVPHPSLALIYSKGDTSFVQFSERVMPGTLNAYHLRVTDWAGNLGPVSDTLFTAAVDADKLSAISGFTVTDTLNGLLLQWSPLPNQALYAAVQILKSRQAGRDYVVVDTVSADAVNYLDREIISNVNYYYKVRPLLFRIPGKDYLPFAEASGARLKTEENNAPAAPQGVRAVFMERGVKLNWDVHPDMNLFAYYVLRGTSPKNMQVISPAIRDTVFIDSLFSSNESGALVYAVQAMNLNQQWGDTSDPVSVLIRQPVVLPAPGGIQVRRRVEGVYLEWDHSYFGENGITGYLLYRRKKGEEFFKPVLTEMISVPFFTDVEAPLSDILEYGVTSVDAWGNQSILSPVASLEPDLSETLPAPSDVSVRNATAGIMVIWPAPYAPGEIKYVVYRKASGERGFKKLATVSPLQPYTDKRRKEIHCMNTR